MALQCYDMSLKSMKKSRLATIIPEYDDVIIMSRYDQAAVRTRSQLEHAMASPACRRN